MSDPLSIAAGVAGFVSLGLQVTGSLIQFYNTYEGQQANIARTTKKLAGLVVVFESLERHLSQRKFQDDEQKMLAMIWDSIEECRECVDELRSQLDRFESTDRDGIWTKARSSTQRLAYPFKEATLQKIEADIREITLNVNMALQVLQQQRADTINDHVGEIKDTISLIQAQSLPRELASWLEAPDTTHHYNDACKRRHRDTGLWFVHGDAFGNWLSSHNSFLWLNGFAGSGKSVLCATIIQHTFRHRRMDPRVGIAFFFFTFRDSSRQSISDMLRSIILQLSSLKDDSYELLQQLRSASPHTAPSDESLFSCLLQLIRSFDDVYILVDALDESPRELHRDEVLTTIARMREWEEAGLHILTTSRDEPDIRLRLGLSDADIVTMKNKSVDKDIAKFIDSHLQQTDNYRLQRWVKHRHLIQKELTQKSDGSFRWVECQFKSVEGCHTLAQLKLTLASLPRSLDETYERMLTSIDEQSTELAKRILTMLCCAKRPLTVREVIEGAAVTLGDDPRVDPESMLQGEEDIHWICPGLIESEKVNIHIGRWSHTTRIQPQDQLRIAHFSVQEYLESDRIGPSTAHFRVQKSQSQAYLACICLTTLIEPSIYLEVESKTEDDSPKRVELGSFYDYATDLWDKHYQSIDDSDELVDRLAVRLFRTKLAFSKWLSRTKGHEQDARGQLSPVYMASLMGLDVIISQLLDDTSWCKSFTEFNDYSVHELVNWKNGDQLSAQYDQGSPFYGTPLSAASYKGHLSTIMLLIDKGADVNAQCGFRGTPLYVASHNGRLAAVKLLLGNGANVNAKGGNLKTALRAASYNFHLSTAEHLLQHGADTNDTNDGILGTALHTASYRGELSTIKLLIDNGADVNAKGSFYGTALQAAAVNGHFPTVKMLIDNGADVNIQAGHFGTALHAASYKDYLPIVEVLIESGADVNAQISRYGAPLQTASGTGAEEVVELLLEKGADINAEANDVVDAPVHRTALQAAYYQGETRVMKLLIQKGASFHASSGKYVRRDRSS